MLGEQARSLACTPLAPLHVARAPFGSPMPPKRGKKRRNKQQAALPKSSEPHNLLELKTIYEGPGGKRSGKIMHKTTIIITNRTVEIEREGANCCLSVLTLGCWFFFFQTASIEIYEVRHARARALSRRRRLAKRKLTDMRDFPLPYSLRARA